MGSVLSSCLLLGFSCIGWRLCKLRACKDEFGDIAKITEITVTFWGVVM